MMVPFSGQSFAAPNFQDPQPPTAATVPPTGPATLGDNLIAPPGTLPGAAMQEFQQVPGDFSGAPPGAVPLDLGVYVTPAPTGRLMLGGTYGTDNGLVGELIIDERDFDITAFPRRPSDWLNPGVWRGGGQTFRAEIVPGTELQRYMINFADPTLLQSNISFSLSGYYFDRDYFDWDERRAGGRVSLGRQLTNYLSVSTGLRMERVTLDNPRLGTSPQLNADLGSNDLYLFSVGLVYDTRQTPFQVDSGAYLGLTYSQAFGDYSYGRGDIDYRIQRVLFRRTATCGHHILSYRTRLGFSGSSTPVFENYFGGGLTSLRGFEYRGVGPVENGIRVGGEFQWLNSLEYQFPITPDDMISAVTFVDFGTIEEDIDINSENFRVAPGVGLRVDLPFSGMSAPLAFDWAFPVSDATGDTHQTFSFMIGYVR